VLTGGRRPDHAFAFQMFSESSTARVALSREVEAPSGHGTTLVPVKAGEWTALDADGLRHSFEWHDRVKSPLVATFDTTFEASYGEAALLARMQAALDDVTAHLDGDAETERLVALVTLRRNGRDAPVVRLLGPSRALPSGRAEEAP
jgi:hypothetical protein